MFIASPIGSSCRVYYSYTRPFLLYTRFPCGASPNPLISKKPPLRKIERLISLQKRQIHMC